jgi:hypothetical protein
MQQAQQTQSNIAIIAEQITGCTSVLYIWML